MILYYTPTKFVYVRVFLSSAAVVRADCYYYYIHFWL